ncbi:MAG: ABC transporter substrate-binding protein [Salinimicrobium sp.]
MKQIPYILFTCLCCLCLSCKTENKDTKNPVSEEGAPVEIKYASGLSIEKFTGYKIVTVKNPWPGAEKSYRYLLSEENAKIPDGLEYDQKIKVPVTNIVVTSTTHIPALEILNEETSLTGFPGLDYISSEKTRKRITKGQVKELGKNEALNTEILLDLQPDVVIGFSINGSNKSLKTIQKSGIPVVFNADWTENSPLGKAEWIKFFGAFFGKTDQANAFFEQVENEYLEARKLARKAEVKPTVLSGAMWKDQWYLPAGNSWQASFIKDANADYLFSETNGNGSLSLSLESVLAKAANADFWVGPAQYTSYEKMKNASPHYAEFDAFKNRRVFTFSSEKGETGGVIFYELAPNRPDLVLKDLISIFHPDLQPNYKTTFYKPLE